jgi:hypothetical protein
MQKLREAGLLENALLKAVLEMSVGEGEEKLAKMVFFANMKQKTRVVLLTYQEPVQNILLVAQERMSLFAVVMEETIATNAEHGEVAFQLLMKENAIISLFLLLVLFLNFIFKVSFIKKGEGNLSFLMKKS